MPSQGERQDFLWRPNTNDSTNLARYDAEAELWYKAFKSAERKHRPRSIKEDFGVIGLVFQLVFSLIFLIVVSIIDFFKWLKS